MKLQIAQVNVGILRYDQDDPRVGAFMKALDEINELGEASDGFVWRYQDESGAATQTFIFEDPRVILNFTIWESIEQLRAFAYKGEHLEYFRRRLEWFEPHTEPSHAMWWVPPGHIPPVMEARHRIEYLREHGPSAAAFGFREAGRFDGVVVPSSSLTG